MIEFHDEPELSGWPSMSYYYEFLGCFTLPEIAGLGRISGRKLWVWISKKHIIRSQFVTLRDGKEFEVTMGVFGAVRPTLEEMQALTSHRRRLEAGAKLAPLIEGEIK